MVNVDVSNSCFWHAVNFDGLAFALSGENTAQTFQGRCMRQSDGRDSVLMPIFKRLVRNKFFVKHRGSDGKIQCHCIIQAQDD